jgi:Ankyrin repeats (many copies)
MIAAQGGHIEVVKALLALPTVDVNATNAQGFTALIRAADQVCVYIPLQVVGAPPPTVSVTARVTIKSRECCWQAVRMRKQGMV